MTGEHVVNFVSTESVPKALSLQEIIDATGQDRTLQFVIGTLQSTDWSSIRNQSGELIVRRMVDCFMKVKDELTANGNLVLRGQRPTPHDTSPIRTLGMH